MSVSITCIFVHYLYLFICLSVPTSGQPGPDGDEQVQRVPLAHHRRPFLPVRFRQVSGAEVNNSCLLYVIRYARDALGPSKASQSLRDITFPSLYVLHTNSITVMQK